jgi:PadR family transcriptional regulator PadR
MEGSGGESEPMRTWVAQLRKGLVELCVMGALDDGEAYGYEILQRLGDAGNLAVTESTVYPILVRLARDDLVEVRTAPSPSGPPRRYYRLTRQGRRRLEEMRRYWRELVESVNDVISGDAS